MTLDQMRHAEVVRFVALRIMFLRTACLQARS